MFHFQLVEEGDQEEVGESNTKHQEKLIHTATSCNKIEDHHTIIDNNNNNNFETTSHISEDSNSRTRPLLVGGSKERSDTVAPPPQIIGAQSSPIHDETVNTGTGPGYLGQKSSSLDSGRVACCTRLAFDLYHKALESARKAIPKKNLKEGYQFPRSFGEDFNSIGPDGFNYLDDTATECSNDYRDIDFNRDSFYFSGQEVLVIPELPETEEVEANIMAEQDKDKVEQVEEEEPQVDLNALLDQGLVEDEKLDESDSKSKEKQSFMKKLFKKKEGSKSRENSEERRRKRRSKSREPSAGRSPRGSSREKSETRSYLEEVLNRSPPEMDENEARLSIHNRQSPVHLVYGRPPEIFIEEVTTLPRTAEEIEAGKGEQMQFSSIEDTPKKKKKINMRFKIKKAKKTGGDTEESFDRAKSLEPSLLSSQRDSESQTDRATSPTPSTTGSIKSKLAIFKRKIKRKPTNDDEALETASHGGESKKSSRSFLKRFKKKKHEEEDFFQDQRFNKPASQEIDDTGVAGDPLPPTRRRASNEKIEAIEIPIGVEVPPDFSIETAPWEVDADPDPEDVPAEPVSLLPASFLQKVLQHQMLPTIDEGNGSAAGNHLDDNNDHNNLVPEQLVPRDVLLQSLRTINQMEDEQDSNVFVPGVHKTTAYVYHFTSDPEEFQPPNSLEEKPKQSKLKSMVGSFSGKIKNFKIKAKKAKDEEPEETEAAWQDGETIEDVVDQREWEQTSKGNVFKETNLDELEEEQREVDHQQDVESIVVDKRHQQADDEDKVSLSYLLSASTTYDAEDDEDEKENAIIKPVAKRMKFKKMKQRALVKDDSYDESEDAKPSWSTKNKQRLQRLKNRATESFNQIADRIKKKTTNKKLGAYHPDDYPPGLYDYEFKMVSDSETTPGVGVDSLRRSRIYVELADAQDRLDMYMQPVGLGGPLRPPRGVKATSSDDFNRSMPSLFGSTKARHQQRAPKRPPPPRPPPPSAGRSTFSIPAAIVTDTGDEISLSTSMCSLWTRVSKARKRASRQRVPADIFYKNVRLGYRPKKSYMEHLERSHNFYSMATLMAAKSQSTGQLSNAIPPPARQKAKTFYVKHRGFRAATSPPPPNSRTSFTTDYEAIERRRAAGEVEEDNFEKYQAQALGRCPSPDPLAWQPFTWKVKRCRSLVELDGSRKQRPSSLNVDVVYSPSSLSQHKRTIAPNPFEEAQKKFFHWLQSSTSLDNWQRKARDGTPQPPALPPRGAGKPPRPPPPPVRSVKLNRSHTTAGNTESTITTTSVEPNFSQRPLPPPPVPPRPKLIPAHYANRSKPSVIDHAVDTSENGFQHFHLCDKSVQVSLASLRQESNGVRRRVQPEDEEEDETIREDHKTIGDSREKMAEVVDDGGGRRRRSKDPNKEEWSDDDTINDDISSISSKYESVMETFNNSSLSSWVHQEQRRHSNATITSTTDEYVTAADHTLASSNRSSMLVDGEKVQEIAQDQERPKTPAEDDFADFQRQFTCMGLVNPSEIEIEDVADELGETSGSNAKSHLAKGANRQSTISTGSSISYSSSSTSSTSTSATVATKRLSTAMGGDDSSSASLDSTIDSTTSLEAPLIVTPTVASSQIQRSSVVALRENIATLPQATPNGSKPNKLYYAAYEIYTTERDYVGVLKMLTQDFADAIKDHVSPQFSRVFFKPLNTICPINEKLLEELEKRLLVDWDDNPKVADIILQFGPFFREYSLYIRQYDQLTTMLTDAERRFPTFKDALERFQASEKCRKLRVFDYLLKPIQRLQQYRLMLMTVQKHEQNDEQTTKAIAMMSDVVDQLNQVPHKEKMKMEMEDLMSRIICKTSDHLRSTGRELVIHGYMQKMSRKEIQDRYLVLFNDLLLYLHPVMNDTFKLVYQMPLSRMKLEVPTNLDRATEFSIITIKRSFQLRATSIEEKQDWVKALTETIREYNRNQHSYVLASNESGNANARDSLASTDSSSSFLNSPGSSLSMLSSSSTNSVMNRSGSIDLSRLSDSSLGTLVEDSVIVESGQIDEATLGKRAPVWVPDYRVTMCQRCLAQFNLITRRHHCRACGYVVCGDCSQYQQRLPYLNFKLERVCCWCNEHLDRAYANMDHHYKVGANNNPVRVKGKKIRSGSLSDVAASSVKTPLPGMLASRVSNLSTGALERGVDIRSSYRTKRPVRVVLIEVPANDKDAQMSGYLYRMSSGKKSWKRFWFLIKDHVLYTYMASEDVKAEETLPLLGYTVQRCEKAIKGHRAENILRLTHNGQPTIFFAPENPATYDRWLTTFDEASKI